MAVILKQGEHVMKAYLFDTKTGLYEGEIFEEADMLLNDDGITPVPPPQYSHGHVPVFDRREKTWAVIPAAIAKQLLRLGDEENTGSKI
jgi:hypothetical protein